MIHFLITNQQPFCLLALISRELLMTQVTAFCLEIWDRPSWSEHWAASPPCAALSSLALCPVNTAALVSPDSRLRLLYSDSPLSCPMLQAESRGSCVAQLPSLTGILCLENLCFIHSILYFFFFFCSYFMWKGKSGPLMSSRPEVSGQVIVL